MSNPIHLDTSFLIRALSPGSREAERITSWIAEGCPLVASTLVWTEFLCGPVDDEAVGLARRVVRGEAPPSIEDAREAARLFNATGRRRGTLVDCLIAACAMRAGAPLATSDLGDFRRFEGLGLGLVE